METDEGWRRLGSLLTKRRQSMGLSTYGAVAAGGPAAKTWDRIAKGARIQPTTLYQACQTLGVPEEEARAWFEMVGLSFDAAGYRSPVALERVVSSLKDARRAVDAALASALQLEAEERSER